MRALYPEVLSTTVIAEYSEQLAALADIASMTAAVPTCGDWTMSDLVWHLMEVQDFWAYIIANRPNGPDEYVRVARPADGELVAGLRGASSRLVTALGSADPADAAWSWADEQTVGFSLRRQTHEALIHLADGLLTVGGPLPQINPQLGADGVDEMVAVMIDDPELDTTVHLVATDTDNTWTVAGSGDGETTISAPAGDLNFWLWGRADNSLVAATGDPADTIALRAFITDRTQ